MPTPQDIALPKLPESRMFVDSDGDVHGVVDLATGYYTADQMNAHYLLGVEDARAAASGQAGCSVPEGYKLISGEAYGQRYHSLVSPDGSVIENAYEQGAPKMFAFLSALAASPSALEGSPVETKTDQLQIAEDFANSLCGMIGDISNALGISEEDQSCANGADEILDAIEELKSRASLAPSPEVAGEAGEQP